MGNRANEIMRPLATTFQWIWKDKSHRFSKWLTNEMPIFLVEGKPGSGKSTLVKHILERRQQSAAQNHELVIGFFFNERGSAIERTMDALFRTFLYQILHQYRQGFRCIMMDYRKKKNSYEETGAERIVWDTTTLRRMFSDLVRSISQDADKTIFQRLLFIVDALDECDTSFSHFKEVLNDLLRDPMVSSRVIKMCCSSRPNNRITFLTNYFSLTLQSRNSEDIKTYVEKTANRALEQNQGFFVLTDEIIDKADGIILWAELVLKELLEGKEDGNNVAELQEALRNIPTGLKELFKRMLGRIDLKYILESKILLRAVLFAQRPLTLEELRRTMAFGFESFPSLSDYNASPRIAHDDVDYKHRLQSRGGGLLEVIAKRSTSESNLTVRFIHQAVKDFIQTESDFLNPTSPDSALSVGHHFLLQSCMRYLALSDFGDVLNDISNLTNANDGYAQLDAFALCKAYPFLEYATLYWVHHWRLASESRNQSSFFMHETRDFMNSGLKNWINMHRVFADEVPEHTQDTTLLSIAAENGIQDFLRSALQDRVSVNQPSGRYGYLLQAAAAHGHEHVVELLLEREAQINAQGGYYGNALIAAASSGHDTVVRCLLNHGAAFSQNATNGQTALKAAIDAGHRMAIKELLRRGAYAAESDTDKSLILNTGAIKGDWPLVELLLLNGAEVNQKLPRTKGKESEEPEGNWTLLHIAIDQRCRSAITKMLLEKGADTSAKDDLGQTALRYALYRGYTEATKLLMTTVQHVEEPTSDDEWSTLHCLAVRGDVAVVQLALSLGPDLDKKTKKGWTALHIAAEAKNLEMLIKLLNQGCVVNDPNDEGWTALHLAVDVGFTEGVMELLNKGADVDGVTPNQWTALHLATYHEFDKIAKRLLAAKPDLSKVTVNGYTALHLAAQNLEQTRYAPPTASGYSSSDFYHGPLYNRNVYYLSRSTRYNNANDTYDSYYTPSRYVSKPIRSRQPEDKPPNMVQILIEAGANINEQTPENWTVLHFAAKIGDIERVELAIANKADINARTKDLWTPLHLAIHHQNSQIVRKLLAADADISVKTDRGVTALHFAVNAEDESVLDLLLSHVSRDASLSFVNQLANSGYTALHLAAELAWVGMVYSLLRKRADAKLQDNDSKTALQLVPENNNEVTFLLLPETANLIGNLIVEPGQKTVLHIAASKGHLRVIELLIKDKVDVNAVDEEKMTPLHEAVKYHQLRAVRLLLKNSANVKAEDAKGRQPLHLAAASNQDQVGTALLNAGASVEATDLGGTTPLHEASKHGHKNLARLLLERSSNVNAVDSYGYTALHWAAEHGHEKVVQTLLKHNAKLEAKDNARQTALHVAVKWRRGEIVQLLLVEAADVSLRTEDGSTALHLAAIQGDEAVMELLLDAGAELNAETNEGKTALQLARENGHEGIVRIFLARDGEVTPRAERCVDEIMEEIFAVVGVAEESSAVGDVMDESLDYGSEQLD
jgi:ankyrin repeat protein